MPDVPISYSRKGIAFARLIHQCFEVSQPPIWSDWQDIPPAENWLKEVYTAWMLSRKLILSQCQ